MVHFERWKIMMIVAVCVLGLLYAMPNVLTPDARQKMAEHMPGWGPTETVKLGLDLQGGAHLLYQVDIQAVVMKRLEDVEDGIRKSLGREDDRIFYRRLNTVDAGDESHVSFVIRNPEQLDEARRRVRALDEGLIVDVDDETNPALPAFEVRYDESSLDQIRSDVISQMIEVVRRRIDPDGTKEPLIAPQGQERVLIQMPGAEDSQEIKDRIGRQAVLTFHEVDGTQTVLPNARPKPGYMVLTSKITEGEQPYSMMVKRTPLITGDELVDSQPSFDQQNLPVVGFRFNTQGARKFGQFTSERTGELFAIVLDGEIISAPRVNEPILGGSGIISGSFTIDEVNELSLLLRAGALPTTMDVVEERTVGPSLGADSIEAGKKAAGVGLVFVIVFITLVYGRFGVYANIALIVNVLLIFAILSMFQATLTLPGIAGIVLTVGMAVDANVLIFERIKEETRLGRTPISAIDSGYSRALTTIVDANVTTLIAAVLLYALGSGPIRGFAVTLTIGILTSMFTAIMVTRLMVVTWLRAKKPTKLAF
ncbi:MAG: protein translocase subunit SecD [Alphaproteobacteria bacterium]